jgi:hypothetical protein
MIKYTVDAPIWAERVSRSKYGWTDSLQDSILALLRTISGRPRPASFNIHQLCNAQRSFPNWSSREFLGGRQSKPPPVSAAFCIPDGTSLASPSLRISQPMSQMSESHGTVVLSTVVLYQPTPFLARVSRPQIPCLSHCPTHRSFLSTIILLKEPHRELFQGRLLAICEQPAFGHGACMQPRLSFCNAASQTRKPLSLSLSLSLRQRRLNSAAASRLAVVEVHLINCCCAGGLPPSRSALPVCRA